MAPVLTDAADRTEELVRRHLPLVDRHVREFAARLPAHVDADDLTGAGRMGLVAAARGYDPAQGTAFPHFASLRIRGAVLDELRSLDWASRSVRSKARRLESGRESLASRLGRAPAPAELAEALGMATHEIDMVEEDVHRAALLSLDGLTPHQAGSLASTQVSDPEESLLRREQFSELHDAVHRLPERLRLVIRGVYFEQRAVTEIGAQLGVSHSRVSQLRAEALRLLRKDLDSDLSSEPSAAGRPARATTPRRHHRPPLMANPYPGSRTAPAEPPTAPKLAQPARHASPTDERRRPDWGLEARIRRFWAAASP